MRLILRLAALSVTAVTLAATTPAMAATAGQLTTWARRYHGIGGFNQPVKAVVSPDGSAVFVTGLGERAGHRVYGTVAYSTATGTTLWSATYPGYAGTGLAVSPDSSTLYVTGAAGTLAYNAATGAVRWTDAAAAGTSAAISPDGSTLYVTNYSTPAGGSYVTSAYAAATGATVWTATYAKPGLALGSRLPGIAVSPDGTTVYVQGQQNSKYATLAYNATTGALNWVNFYRGAVGNTDSIDFAVSPDGSTVYVTGDSSPSAGASFDYATVAINAATGKQLWARLYNGPANADDEASSVAVSPDGSSVYVTGQSTGSAGNYDYATLDYNAATGATQWVRRYNGPQDTAGGAVFTGLSPDGSTLYVAGDASGGYGTIAYNAATGTELWTRLYHGPGNSSALTGAVNPVSPQVIVTGTGAGTSGTQQYATVSYAG